MIPALIIYGAILFADRMKNWERGAPDNRATTRKNVKKRFEDFRAGVYMKTLLREPAAGVMHSLIYFPFRRVITPPLVSIPSESGVTSRRRTSLTSPTKTPA